MAEHGGVQAGSAQGQELDQAPEHGAAEGGGSQQGAMTAEWLSHVGVGGADVRAG